MKKAKPTPVLNDSIRIRGARQNNLKGFDLDIPLGRLNVVSGPSGSGKSSLAFDTIYAEGQRRYVETFSPYTRQFMDRMDKPKVDAIHGIPPAIAIEQSNHVKSTRSTVGTITEINDYLKILMPRLAKAYCPECSREIRLETAKSIAGQIFKSAKPSKKKNAEAPAVLITFGVPVPAKTKPAEFFDFLCAQGYLRVWLNGVAHRTDEKPDVPRLPAVVRVIQDRVTLTPENQTRLFEAIEAALRLGRGQLAAIPAEAKQSDYTEIMPFSTGWHCAHCDIEIAPPSPGLFSFNNPLGACPTCRGFGRSIGIDLDRAIPDRSLSIAEGVVKPFQTENGAQCQHDLLRACKEREIDIRAPFDGLPKAEQDFVIFGEKRGSGQSIEDLSEDSRWYGVKGFFDWLETKSYKMHVRVLLSRYRNYTLCVDCRGGRYQPSTLNFRLAGRTLPELAGMPVEKLAEVMDSLKPEIAAEDPNTEMLRAEIAARLRYLAEVGLAYLTLDRATKTLSGGEVERVNLTTCLGASLVNALFVMDEPSVGLHQRDVGRLIRVMKNLRDKGNTLLVVEHEESVIRAADNLIELGPGRGEQGGGLVFNGPVNEVKRVPESLTGDYLAGRRKIPVPENRRTPKHWLEIKGAAEHNLHKIDVKIPLGVFTCVTGVSGSGKSTLVNDVLYENFQAQRGLSTDESAVGRCAKLIGTQRVESIILVDQSPLSRTPRSSPAVYLGAFDPIREIFALQPEAAEAGLMAGAFSFNSGKGRCDRCNGNGFEKVEMQFLSDIFVRCPECDGKRYQPHVLKIKVGGKSIHDVLDSTVTDAIAYFSKLRDDAAAADKHSPLARQCQKAIDPLRILEEVGLGYLRLGQPLNVLSGGESQRLKLVGHLATQGSQDSLLIFDEPTTGLHFDDIAMLVKVFDRLVQQGNTLVVIEHNLEVIKCADHVIDLGPEAGEAGGLIVAAGTPEQVAAHKGSHTGRYLGAVLAHKPVDEVEEAAGLVAEAPAPYALKSSGIDVRGAREHNLKNISLTIPRDQIVVVTGLSGSGKSTLAFDILFAEGQRRFLDSMSPYARQFVEQLEKPDVDLITGLPPSVAIEQRVTRGGGKSTVATVTEVYHFLRLMFAKLGTQWCPKCKAPVEGRSVASIVAQTEALARQGRIRVLATLVKARKGFHTDVAQWAVKHGFETLLVDGRFVAAEGFQKLERFREHTIDVLLGEAAGEEGLRPLVERALEIGKGTARILDGKNRSTILSTEMNCPKCGEAFEELDPRLFSFNSPHGWCTVCRGFGEVWDAVETPERESALEAELDEERQHEWLDEGEAVMCPGCKGSRLNAVARNVRIGQLTIDDITSKSVRHAQELLGGLCFDNTQGIIAADILPEIGQRLEFMARVGLDYLALSRSAKTLSGGESQRIRLAAQLGSNLRGVLYVLDEPTIGLHPRDNQALLDTLETLKSKGNSLVIVEHDEDTMRRADTIIDLGPRAGSHGGEVIPQGPMASILKNPRSATGRCLREPLCHPTRGERRSLKNVAEWIKITGACVNNLKDIDVRFPVGRFSVITGISGSGKSTLMRGVLLPAVKNALSRRKSAQIHGFEEITGTEHLANVYEVDQSPIGKTSRSTPATYIGFFDDIRKQFAQVPAARMRGYTASRFSFNNEGGRCETCGGQGVIKVEMNFLPASYIPCGDCHGKRYNAPTLEVLYNGKSIGDVLDLTFEEAAEFFGANPRIERPLSLLVETGLGYLKLGQPSPTLSGGEAQRLKLVTELTRGLAVAETTRIRRQRTPKSTLYLLEEPTIGLHMADVHELLKVLHRLVDDGNTVVVIEHNISLVADADYVIDIGPEAGDAGGQVVAEGTPEQIAKSKASHTAPFLRDALRGVTPESAAAAELTAA
ncbi:MAG TPA: excinuclease ABC subunit UvrA [Chthoniobacteraceae bacterium]|nr:excinuclease ABC subunit UvrA [Chthoniobacteraceae bacterium]